MPITADPVTLKRLVLVRQLYQQALIQSASQHHLVSKIMSVISFDLAVETILKLIIGVLDPHNNPKDERTFPQYKDKADKLMVANNLNLLPDKRNIDRVHSIRNDAQHNAKSPSDSDLNDCRTYTRDFLFKLTSQVWDLPFNKISLTNLVSNTQSKRLLITAEDAFNRGEYKEAAAQAVAALTWTINQVAPTLVGEAERDKYWGAFLWKKAGVLEESALAYRALWTMRDTLLIIALGLNNTDYIRYKETVKDLGVEVMFFNRNEPQFAYRPSGVTPANSDSAEYVFAYATDTVIQIENRVGDIDKPFGIKRRFMDGHN